MRVVFASLVVMACAPAVRTAVPARPAHLPDAHTPTLLSTDWVAAAPAVTARPPVLPDRTTAAYAAAEAMLVANINELRRAGSACGRHGYFPPTTSLRSHIALRRAARQHSRDMAGREYVSHVSPEGKTFRDRAEQAGYWGSMYGETLAAHLRDPNAVLLGFRLSDNHCAVLMTPEYAHVGVGFHPAPEGGYWTALLGTPARAGKTVPRGAAERTTVTAWVPESPRQGSNTRVRSER